MRNTFTRLAVACAALMLGGLASGATVSAAPNLVPRHQAVSKIAPEPGLDPGATEVSGCGAGRFAVNCGAAVPGQVPVPSAARRAMEADARARVASGVPAQVPVKAPAAARRAMQADARSGMVTGGGTGSSAVVPHGARAALEAE